MAAALLMPLPLLLLLAGLGLLFVAFGLRRFGLGVAFASLVLLAVLSWAPVSDRLLSPFESKYAALNDKTVLANLDYVVVLGGGWDGEAFYRPAGIRLSESSMVRLVEGLRLLEVAQVLESDTVHLVVSGASRIDEPPVAWGYRDAALDLGVSENRLIVLDAPTDTGHEARAFADRLRKQGVDDLSKVKFTLVTSASHMPRAISHFLAVGLKPIAAPTHFMAYTGNSEHFGYWVPSASHLRKTERAWYELLAGMVVQVEH